MQNPERPYDSLEPSDTALARTADPAAKPSAGPRYECGALIAGKYQLSVLLGQGGMGSVWLAKNRTLDLDVALKVMRAELADEVHGVAERMVQEARAAASVGHPGIVKVFDFGFTDRGDPFIVMEALSGESLHAAMRRRGRLSPTRAAQTMLPIIDALAATHSRGIVHRDLKPENIFLARLAGQRLQPKVLDFGIAKLECRAAERLTRGGAVLGSPAYMSPEQLRGDVDVDARADIWALAVVFYEMITGRGPFQGESYHASMWNVLNAPPRQLSEHGIDDLVLARILERALQKDRDARHEDMRVFGRDLARWLSARGVQEDVCEASLGSWLDAPAQAAIEHSFFPSHAPRSREAPGPLVLFGSQPEDGTTAEPLPAAAPGLHDDARGVTSALVRRWLPVTVVAAAVAFVLAAFWFGQGRSYAGSAEPLLRFREGAFTGTELEGDGAELPEQERRELTPLPKSALRYAPLPRRGANAPVLYVDEPTRP